MEQLKSYIYKIVADVFKVTVEEISDGTGPNDLYHWDSLGQLELILRLEKRFNIKLSLEDAMSINSVNDVIAVIKKYVSK